MPGILQQFILVVNTILFPNSLNTFCAFTLQIRIEFAGAEASNNKAKKKIPAFFTILNL
jgi:hypothetical protein